MYIALILIFVFGAIIGSFLNVVALRHNTGKSVINGRSECATCSQTLKAHELIPIFSFLIQKGKCRTCKSKISWQYPTIEILTGLFFTGASVAIYQIFYSSGFMFDRIPEFFIANILTWLLVSFLVIILIYDGIHMIIPNEYLVPSLIISFLLPTFLYSLAYGEIVFIPNLIDGIITALPFMILYFLGKGKWLGFGDVKLGLIAGFLLGYSRGLIAVLFSFWIGAIIGIIYLIFYSKKYKGQTAIPFAPSIIFAIFIVFMTSVSWQYINSFFQMFFIK